MRCDKCGQELADERPTLRALMGSLPTPLCGAAASIHAVLSAVEKLKAIADGPVGWENNDVETFFDSLVNVVKP